MNVIPVHISTDEIKPLNVIGDRTTSMPHRANQNWLQESKN